MSNQRELTSGVVPPLKQGENRVETGLDLAQVADLLEKASGDWKERGNLSVDLLRALCRLSRKDPVAAEDGFSALELRQEIRTARKGWCPDNDPEEISKKVRQEYKALKQLLVGKAEHIGGLAREVGLTAAPDIDRQEGGGGGKVTRYYLCTRPFAVETPAPTPPKAVGAQSTLTIKYICEDSRQSRWLKRFVGGVPMQGAARVAYLAVGLILLVITLILASLALWVLVRGKSDWATLKASIAIAVLVVGLYRQGFPLFQVLWERILSAPGWMQSVDDDRLIEWRCPPRYPTKTIHLVRYSGECPLCNGKVVVRRRRWYGAPPDLVGRCEEAPAQHIFTFDHVLRVGQRCT